MRMAGLKFMDTFFEQLVVRKMTAPEKVIKILTIAFGVIAICLLMFLSFTNAFSGFITLLFLPAALGLGVLLWFQIKNMYIEYEYSITNGSLDIDRIRGKRKRERMVSVECSDFEEFGVYDESAAQKFKGREFGGRAFAANHDSKELYYAVSRHKTFGNVFIVIEPNDRIKGALKKFIPKQVQGNVLGGYGHSEN